MARLIYSAICSLDGYVEDGDGRFEWAAPDEEVMTYLNDREQPVGTYLYGRRMYDTMRFWETADTGPDQSAADRDFTGIWRSADKIVYSRSLRSATTAKTRIESRFDPDSVGQLKATADRDLGVGGADLAGRALAAALVDQVQLYLVPVVVGGGKRALPEGVDLRLTLEQVQRFASGFVFLDYAVNVG